ncbi:MAG: glycosyltransferase family 2 protein [Planctomycetia bacterium]|nr:glycosyltransferase family 2 protein [Planctomycetia bacterium]
MFLSLVIPVYNEEESLQELIRQIEEVCAQNHYEKEVIFVDDGSSDTSWEIISSLAAEKSYIHAVRFRRNFGKAAALEAGFSRAKGEFVMTMDADLQDDPAEIPNFLSKMSEGYDVVSGWKKVRHDPWHKVYPSRLFNKMVSSLTGVTLHDHNCGMKCYRAQVLKEVAIYGERHRFIPVLAGARGFRVTEVVIQHRARKFGVSKYGFSRFLKGFLDLLSVKLATTYGQRPLHVMGGAAVVMWLFAALLFLLNILISVTFTSFHSFFNTCTHTISYFCGYFGMMLMACGITAELITAFYQQGMKHSQTNFSIQEIIRDPEPTDSSPSVMK